MDWTGIGRNSNFRNEVQEQFESALRIAAHKRRKATINIQISVTPPTDEEPEFLSISYKHALASPRQSFAYPESVEEIVKAPLSVHEANG